jgi:hypothetical protein
MKNLCKRLSAVTLGALALATVVTPAFALPPDYTTALAGVSTSIESASTAIVGYLPAAIGAGLVIGVILFGAKKGWRAFKGMAS